MPRERPSGGMERSSATVLLGCPSVASRNCGRSENWCATVALSEWLEGCNVNVAGWLAEHGLGHYAEAFAEAAIDFDILPELTDGDLEKLAIPLGDRKRLLKAIAALVPPSSDTSVVAAASPTSPTPTPRPDAERRQMTVMFVDLVDSTELAAKLDPEDMSALICAYQNAVAGEIARFEGHVAKYMGYGVLAYFGWPSAHEDEAERAVRAGLAIAKGVADLEAPDGVRLAVRIGVATGLVVVGDLLGDAEARERAVVGETPNLAARLQALASRTSRPKIEAWSRSAR
jgi:class 3 adenylate cyclase